MVATGSRQQRQFQWTTEQALQLLRRLASTSDLALYKEKKERIHQLADQFQELKPALADLNEFASTSSAALANGLHLLLPLLQLDLPKDAVVCIADIQRLMMDTELLYRQLIPSAPGHAGQLKSYSRHLSRQAVEAGLPSAAAVACEGLADRLCSKGSQQQSNSEQSVRVGLLVSLLAGVVRQLLSDHGAMVEHGCLCRLLLSAARLAAAILCNLDGCSGHDVVLAQHASSISSISSRIITRLHQTKDALEKLLAHQQEQGGRQQQLLDLQLLQERWEQVLVQAVFDALQSGGCMPDQLVTEACSRITAIQAHLHLSEDVALLAVFDLAIIAQQLHHRQGAQTPGICSGPEGSGGRCKQKASSSQRQQPQQQDRAVQAYHTHLFQALGMRQAHFAMTIFYSKREDYSLFSSHLLHHLKQMLYSAVTCLQCCLTADSIPGDSSDDSSEEEQVLCTQQEPDMQQQLEPVWLTPMMQACIELLALWPSEDTGVLLLCLHLLDKAFACTERALDASSIYRWPCFDTIGLSLSEQQLAAVQHIAGLQSTSGALAQQLCPAVLQLLGPVVVQACRNNQQQQQCRPAQSADASEAEQLASNGAAASVDPLRLVKFEYASVLNALYNIDGYGKTQYLTESFKQQPVTSAAAIETALRSEMGCPEQLIRHIAQSHMGLCRADSIRQIALEASTVTAVNPQQLSRQLLTLLASAQKAVVLLKPEQLPDAWRYVQLQGIAETACILAQDSVSLGCPMPIANHDALSISSNNSAATECGTCWVVIVARCLAVMCRYTLAANGSKPPVKESISPSTAAKLDPMLLLASMAALVLWLGRALLITARQLPGGRCGTATTDAVLVFQASMRGKIDALAAVVQGRLSEAADADPVCKAIAAASADAAAGTCSEMGQLFSLSACQLFERHIALQDSLLAALTAANTSQAGVRDQHVVLQGLQQLVGRQLLLQLQEFAEQLCAALPLRYCCNNLYCRNVSWQSDAELVNSKGSRCSGCKTSYYCCRECQVASWKLHKTICKMIAACKD